MIGCVCKDLSSVLTSALNIHLTRSSLASPRLSLDHYSVKSRVCCCIDVSLTNLSVDNGKVPCLRFQIALKAHVCPNSIKTLLEF